MGHTDRPGQAGFGSPRLSQRMGMTAPQHHHDTKNRLEVSSFFYKIVSENMVNLWSTKRMFIFCWLAGYFPLRKKPEGLKWIKLPVQGWG